MKDRLNHMKEMLMGAVETAIYNLEEADAKELGEAVDMIKDIEETLYYCSIVEAMEEDSKPKHEMYYPVVYIAGMR